MKNLVHDHQWWRNRCREAWQHIRDMQTDKPSTAWKPILTAPKDGTGILVAVTGMKGRFEIVWWRRTEGDYGFWFDGFRTYSDSVFSHWMPLPEAPE